MTESENSPQPFGFLVAGISSADNPNGVSQLKMYELAAAKAHCGFRIVFNPGDELPGRMKDAYGGWTTLGENIHVIELTCTSNDSEELGNFFRILKRVKEENGLIGN